MLDKAMAQIINISPVVQHVLLVDRANMLMKYLSRDHSLNNEIFDRLTVMGGATFQTGEDQGECMNLGELELQISEYSHGFIFGMSAGTAILLVSTTKNAKIGEIWESLKRIRPEIENIVNEYFCMDTGIGDTADVFKSTLY